MEQVAVELRVVVDVLSGVGFEHYSKSTQTKHSGLRSGCGLQNT